jgi:hypothetical protein
MVEEDLCDLSHRSIITKTVAGLIFLHSITATTIYSFAGVEVRDISSSHFSCWAIGRVSLLDHIFHSEMVR